MHFKCLLTLPRPRYSQSQTHLESVVTVEIAQSSDASDRLVFLKVTPKPNLSAKSAFLYWSAKYGMVMTGMPKWIASNWLLRPPWVMNSLQLGWAGRTKRFFSKNFGGHKMDCRILLNFRAEQIKWDIEWTKYGIISTFFKPVRSSVPSGGIGTLRKSYPNNQVQKT